MKAFLKFMISAIASTIVYSILLATLSRLARVVDPPTNDFGLPSDLQSVVLIFGLIIYPFALSILFIYVCNDDAIN